ncbi:hypothetical protein Bbelb_114650 [Branchiostoma belcheri]|nr:hypothetical protein Bbelb_114650 [Branchiostoma belcheri]
MAEKKAGQNPVPFRPFVPATTTCGPVWSSPDSSVTSLVSSLIVIGAERALSRPPHIGFPTTTRGPVWSSPDSSVTGTTEKALRFGANLQADAGAITSSVVRPVIMSTPLHRNHKAPRAARVQAGSVLASRRQPYSLRVGPQEPHVFPIESLTFHPQDTEKYTPSTQLLQDV